MKRYEMDLCTGALWKKILLFSVPLMFTNLLQVVFNMSDVAVVGKFAGSLALGSVGSTSILVTMFTGILIGMASGVNALTALYIGAKNDRNVRETVHTSCILCLSSGLLILLFGFTFARHILTMMNTKPELIDGAVRYLRIYVFGMPALALFNFGNAVLSASGDTKRPLYYLSFAGVINVILNLFFVIICKLDVAGVALASIIAEYISAALVIALLLRSRENYALHPSELQISPDTHLAKEAGLELGIRGSIAVNERMETSVPDIYAVGDAVEVTHFVTGQKALISLAGPANKQGRIAADNICGGNSRFHGSQGSSVLKLFGLTAASTGINEKKAQAAEIAYDKVVLFPASHATYYPGAQSMAMKVLYEKESLRLLGAQIVGGEGVDKRIDVLATAIRAKMTALELTELDLSYAPPYSSAKDPVNMAGFMIEDLESGKVQQFHWNDVEDLPCDGSATLLDVRTEGEYRRGHLNGFRNIPLDDLREHLNELERDKPVYVNCQTGLRSYLACRLLTQYGFSCSHLSGGYSFYQVVTQEQQTARSAYPCGMEKL